MCIKLLFQQKQNIKLVIIGSGENKENLELLISRYNLKNKIYLVGYKHNVFKYFKKSKAFILPSLWEDPGFVLIESMLSNTLVISSDCPSGPKEILDNNRGILFKNNSKSDFIEKFNLLTSLNYNQKLQIKKLAKKFVKRFTLLSHHNKLVNLFN